MSDDQIKEAKGGILLNEIGLCDKMLAADEWNFHCWNYWSWIIQQKLDNIVQVCLVWQQNSEEAKS